jgi:hypothetical protein
MSAADQPELSSSAEDSEATELAFGILVLICFVVGVFVNAGCLYSLRRRASTFHKFLKALAVFDLLVVVCCFWMYALPVLSKDFHKVSMLVVMRIQYTMRMMNDCSNWHSATQIPK